MPISSPNLAGPFVIETQGRYHGQRNDIDAARLFARNLSEALAPTVVTVIDDQQLVIGAFRAGVSLP